LNTYQQRSWSTSCFLQNSSKCPEEKNVQAAAIGQCMKKNRGIGTVPPVMPQLLKIKEAAL
jgi:hypothetical protein